MQTLESLNKKTVPNAKLDPEYRAVLADASEMFRLRFETMEKNIRAKYPSLFTQQNAETSFEMLHGITSYLPPCLKIFAERGDADIQDQIFLSNFVIGMHKRNAPYVTFFGETKGTAAERFEKLDILRLIPSDAAREVYLVPTPKLMTHLYEAGCGGSPLRPIKLKRTFESVFKIKIP